MAKRMLKSRLLIAVSIGTVFGCGCCFPCMGGFNPCNIVQDLVLDAAWEFVYDNDAVFDLFEDDFGTGLFYDDRNTAAPIREEP